MLELWGRRNASNVMPVTWALGELGLPYRRHDVGTSFGGLDTDTASYGSASARVLVDFKNPGLNTGDAAGDVYASIENLSGGADSRIVHDRGVADREIGGDAVVWVDDLLSVARDAIQQATCEFRQPLAIEPIVRTRPKEEDGEFVWTRGSSGDDVGFLEILTTGFAHELAERLDRSPVRLHTVQPLDPLEWKPVDQNQAKRGISTERLFDLFESFIVKTRLGDEARGLFWVFVAHAIGIGVPARRSEGNPQVGA